MFFSSLYFLHVSQTERSSDQIGSRADTENVSEFEIQNLSCARQLDLRKNIHTCDRKAAAGGRQELGICLLS